MTEQTMNYTAGEQALMAAPPIITVNGIEYKCRRLGMVDTLRIAKIIAIGAGAVGQNLAAVDLEDAAGLSGQVIQWLVAGMPYAETQVLDLFASLLGVSGTDIRNPDKFPMGSELIIGEALSKHPDIHSFFANLGGLLTTLLPPMPKETLPIVDAETPTPGDSSADSI